MKTRIIACIFLFCLANSASAEIKAEVPEDKVKAFYDSLNTWCGNGLMFVNRDFEKNFTEKDQADVLAEIIERSAKIPNDSYVLLHAMGMAGSFVRPDGTRPWNPRLESVLLAQAHNSNPYAREALVAVLLNRHENKQRDMILSFLKDDNDEVRQSVLDGINKAKWPDALTICKEYIDQTQPEGSYKGSVICAKRYTNPEDDYRAELIFNKLTEPHALEDYASYSALHKNDPDYEVSVDCAERLSKSIQDDLNYNKAVEEEKKREDMVHKLVADQENGKPPQPRSFPEQVDFLYWLFDTKDSSTAQYAARYFVGSIPSKDRTRLLTSIAKRATQTPVNNQVLMDVLILSEFQPNEPVNNRIWSEELESLIWGQKNNPDRNVRSYAIRVLEGWGPDSRRNKILFFLNDEDSFVRETCIGAIYRWPDSRDIYAKYVKEHQSDPECHQTIYSIKELTRQN
jgi:HEAT repeat protein